MKNSLVAISIFSLAVSFVIGSWLISNGLNANIDNQSNLTVEEKTVEKEVKKLFTQEELASYLGLSIEESIRLGPIPVGENTESSVLPFIEIGDTVYYSKEAID
ncbi:hypothetical protein [Paenisporosarcina sp. TG20]|uniref:hypothetical protein n=1 Tax=Paenisporosarcina sp. TG20 TaxID=1211706 RepID=UPI00030AD536|nr:hypothetical protein [Paenisporosarcina sp. TG20]